jgi:hypothetical protein
MQLLFKTSFKSACALLFMILFASFAHAQVSGGAFNGFKQNSKDPIQIEADELEVIDAKSTAIYKGNVKIRQGASLITTSRLDVIYDKDGEGGHQTTQSKRRFGCHIQRQHSAGRQRGVLCKKREHHSRRQCGGQPRQEHCQRMSSRSKFEDQSCQNKSLLEEKGTGDNRVHSRKPKKEKLIFL